MTEKVAIQGTLGSFYDQAARQYFGEDYSPLYNESFDEVFTVLDGGLVDYGLAAIHNTIHGPIAENEKLVDDFKHTIEVTGEVKLPIHFFLIGLPNSKLADICSIHSQYEALRQCGNFFSTLPEVKIVQESDTAGSVVLVKKWGDLTAAAVASANAARIYDMKVLASNIEDQPDNVTRFLVLQRIKRT
jgi:prephenate dehydratase